jgi:sugar porter (SP) family MFS transporter
MVSINQFAIVTGMLVVYFVNYFIAAYGSAIGEQMAVGSGNAELVSWNVQYGWRWMFGSEALPATLLLVLMCCVPESPRWLAKQHRHDEALAILTRVGGAEHAQVELADIKDAIAQESGSLRQLFTPGMRIVLVIGVVLAVLQQVTGINVFLYYAPEIFKGMGAGTHAALLQTVLVGAVNLTFTVLAIWTVDRLGRKPLMLVGFTGMGISLLAMGLVAYYQQTEVWVLVFILGYIACFALSVGPVTWVILSEIFPTTIRGRAMAIATVCLWLANFLVTQTFTIMDKSPWLVERFHNGFPFFVYAALCVVAFAFMALYVPETKGKTLEEIERTWMSPRRETAPANGGAGKR